MGLDRAMYSADKSRARHSDAIGRLGANDRGEASRSPCQACPVRLRSICSGLDFDELEELEKIVARMTVGAGGPIFDEGEAARCRYNVTSGSIKIYKLLGDGRRQIIGFLFPGDFLGLAMADEYAYGAEAVVDSELCRFPRRELDDLINRFPTLENRLLNVTSNELAVAQEQMVLLGRKTAKEKVATMLLLFSRRAAERGMADNPVYLPMTRTDIGDYLGLTTETVSRTFTQLRAQRIISAGSGGRIWLEDLEILGTLMEGF
jgi:CRP/FNR family transcriptional regulator